MRTVSLLLLLVVTCAAFGGALGWGAAGVVASSYTAKATVLVTPLEGNPFNPSGNGDDLNNLQSEAQLAQSDAVADLLPERDRDVQGELTVQVPSNTQLLEFTFTSSEREAARVGAQGFASAYLKFRTGRADQAVVAQSRAIQDEIDAQSARINALARQKRSVGSAEQRAAIQQQMNGITAQIVQLSTTLSAVTTVDRDPGQVVTPGHLVGRTPQTNQLLFSLAGAILMCTAGVAALLLLARRRTSPTAADEPPTVDRQPARERSAVPPRKPSVGKGELAARGSVK